jgi:hypothetical protein
MSKSKSSSKKKIELNGRTYRYGDLYDSWNKHQKNDFDGIGDGVYAPIPQENGEPLPSLAEQWKEDYRKRFVDVKSPRNR